ncbi:hypothetical protein F5I97DRAFT_1001042 [Phlebopus sp. FC_14]|nr:hypothetical protein F5I97DRAFT_1001042 [Phlebopus sp. FC_14]
MDSTRLDALKTTFTSRIPYCSGTCHVPVEYLTLFYSHGEDESASRVNLSNATAVQLESLSRACQPATFGLNNENRLDETYRKAGKLDLGNFSTPFDPTHAGIVDHICNELLVGDQKLELELYKLNVYEKDGFFKRHQDTPRSERMFGSLVVIFPTGYEGGELIFRHDGDEFVVEFTDAFKQASQPSVGYVAFFGDIEHEVAPVRSGYRVTLTYNLYFGSPGTDQSVPRALPNISPQEKPFETSLVELINCPDVLPQGGYLGFGLQYQYPVTPKQKLSTLKPFLKGSDAVLASVCNRLSLSWDIKVLYVAAKQWSTTKQYVLIGNIPDYKHMLEDDDIIETLEKGGGVEVNIVGSSTAPVARSRWDSGPPPTDLLAIRNMNGTTKITTRYVAYGNEPQISHMYGHLCLVVRLDSAANREKF